MRAYFDRFVLDITRKDAEYASHAGNCDQEVAELVESAPIKRQLDKISPFLIVKELQEYGAWDDSELSDWNQNLHRIVWIAAGNIREECSGKTVRQKHA